MKSLLSFLFFLLFIYPNLIFAQSVKLSKLIFEPVFGYSELNLNDSFYRLKNGDSIQFQTLKFYISKIEFINNEETVWKENKSFHLMDGNDKKSLSIQLTIPTNIIYTSLKFNIGIDSITNVSGAIGGDLDPTKGMYWTWQSGYINFKIEGKSNLCKTRNNEFQFHIGGYQYPFNCLQIVKLNCKQSDQIKINIDVSKFLDKVDLSKQNHIMSPSNESVLLSNKLLNAFSINK
jgi:hypothetical protein